MPTSVTDEHLRRASGQQLKVLLYCLRHNGDAPDLAAVAAGTGLSREDASDAMQYWVETGYLIRDGEVPAANPPATSAALSSASEKPEEKKLLEVPDVLPTYDQVAARTKESEELAGLFNEAQSRLGKTIGYDTQSKLLMMLDSYGLPPEVILTIIEYAVSNGKGNMSYICKVGKNWAENGIDSLEAAEERLQELAARDTVWDEFVSLFPNDPPRRTTIRVDYVKRWRNDLELSPELIFYAYEQMIETINKVNFKYMDKMLTGWNDQGMKSPVEVLQSRKNGQPKTPAAASGKRAPSYDSELYRKKARGPITYQRKEASDGE